jgi:hypothetical protein
MCPTAMHDINEHDAYAVEVRTTVTLDEAIRQGAQRRSAPVAFETQKADLGVPSVSLHRALQIASEIEDEELIRRQRGLA